MSQQSWSTKSWRQEKKTRKDFTEALLTQITKLLKDDKVRIDFNTEMSRFVPESIRQRTIDNPEYWDYVQTEIKSMAMPMFKDDKPRNRFGMSL